MSGNSNAHYGKDTLCRAVVETSPRVEYSHKREYVGQNGRFLLFTESSAILSVSVPDKNNTNLAKTPQLSRFLQILERCTYSITILAFAINHQK